MIKEYRKTATIDAIQWDGSPDSTFMIVNWAAGFGSEIFLVWSDGAKMEIPTLEGPLYASVGDFIAKGVNNEFWAIKPEIMAETYAEV